MIKVCKFFYIHWLFLAIVAFMYINRQLDKMLIALISVSVHEMAHLISAVFLGLTVDYVVLYPFGLNLKLKNTILYSITDEIILYSSGPLSNIVVAVMILPIASHNLILKELYYTNLSLFFINLIPISPLDGGNILKKILIHRFGFRIGKKISTLISVCFALMLIVFSVCLVYRKQFNPTLILFIVFIFGNILFSKEKYNSNVVKELLYNTNKRKNKEIYKAKIIAQNKNKSLSETVNYFNMVDNYFVFLTDGDDKLEKILSENEVINYVLKE